MQSKHVSNEDLSQRISALEEQVQILQSQVQPQQIATNQENAVKFLLAEFDLLGQLRQEVDSRLATTLNLYLTGSALIIPVLLYASQQFNDVRLFITVITVVALVLLTAGLLLARALLRNKITKHGYNRGLNLIRRYFVDHDSSIEPYLSMPVPESPIALTKLKSRTIIYSLNTSLLALYLWNSALFGFIVGSVTWLTDPGSFPTITIIIGIIAGVLCFSGLWYITKHQFVHRLQL